MTQKLNFNPGPSQLYFTVEDHMRKAFREGVPSLSHRSKAFENISLEATTGLRALLNIPGTHHILFLSSATEIWERIIQNLVETHSHHFVNGAFSKRFYEIAGQLNKQPTKTEVKPGEGFNENIALPATELLAVTHNETSTGVAVTTEYIHGLKAKIPNTLLTVDAVSSLPYPDFDYSKLDSVFFSVQKGFGLPAGLGVWIVNNHCLAKAEALKSNGISVGSYHDLPGLIAFGQKNQTPETPNVLSIYLLSKVVQDMLRRGIQVIRKETEYKSAILYELLNNHSYLKSFVSDESSRSKTVIVADCSTHKSDITKFLEKKGIHAGEGYGPFKDQHLRFANFPAHSKEQFEYLVDTLIEFKG